MGNTRSLSLLVATASITIVAFPPNNGDLALLFMSIAWGLSFFFPPKGDSH